MYKFTPEHEIIKNIREVIKKEKDRIKNIDNIVIIKDIIFNNNLTNIEKFNIIEKYIK